MTAFFAAIVDFVSAHPHFAYGAVFLLALSEAMPIIGTMVPGSTLILGISALAPRGIVQLWPLLIAAIMGAIAGDALSFWLGHRYHRGILLLWPLNRYPQSTSGLVETGSAMTLSIRSSTTIAILAPGRGLLVALFAASRAIAESW
jgi:membrane protein DedA with SNARE-associated domain